MSVLYFLKSLKSSTKFGIKRLLFKLKQKGINGKLQNLFKTYLTNWKQQIFLNGSESEWGLIESGVPNILSLDPFFLIYTNDLEDGIKSLVSFL